MILPTDRWKGSEGRDAQIVQIHCRSRSSTSTVADVAKTCRVEAKRQYMAESLLAGMDPALLWPQARE